MKTHYKFIFDIEPTDEELAEIMSAATKSVLEKSIIAREQLRKNLNEYLEATKKIYANRLIANEPKA